MHIQAIHVHVLIGLERVAEEPQFAPGDPGPRSCQKAGHAAAGAAVAVAEESAAPRNRPGTAT
eukprot:11204060-Lingulodinium_polyedra.AAC.1